MNQYEGLLISTVVTIVVTTVSTLLSMMIVKQIDKHQKWFVRVLLKIWNTFKYLLTVSIILWSFFSEHIPFNKAFVIIIGLAFLSLGWFAVFDVILLILKAQKKIVDLVDEKSS